MHAGSLASKLPPFFQTAPFLNVAQLFDNSLVNFSSLYCLHEGKLHLFKKDDTSYVELDWQIYSILRASANLKVTTGANVRAQPSCYLSHQSYSNPDTAALYKSLQPEKQQVLILSNAMKKQQKQKFVNPDCYELVDTPEFTSLSDLFTQLKHKTTPVLLEVGTVTMRQLFKQFQSGKPNPLDKLLVSIYDGQVPPQYLGQAMDFPVEQYFQLEWTSQKYPCVMHTGKQGSLIFKVYKAKHN